MAALAISSSFAGGNVSPVAEVVETVEQTFPQWDFNGQAVVYYQTLDKFGTGSLFEQESSLASAGLQLNAVGTFDYGLSVGAQVTGLGTLGLQNQVVSNIMQSADGNLNGGAVTKLYGQWSNGANTLKIGRQELPKALSPFAWSESWNVFKNTYEAGVYINTMVPSTVLVGAWVSGANQNGVGAWDANGNWFTHGLHSGASNLNDFNKVNGTDGIFMVTAQNKSIPNLTITGSFYYGANLVDNMMNKIAEMNGEAEAAGTGDATTIIWGDALYASADLPVSFAVQGGQISVGNDLEDTTAYGAKIAGKFGVFGVKAAYSSVDEGFTGVFNVGGVKTPLYTQMILNQDMIASNADTFLIGASADALGGKFILNYGGTTMNDRVIDQEAGTVADVDYAEVDFIYKTKVWNDSTTLLAAYVYQDHDLQEDANNVLRFWARYNF